MISKGKWGIYQSKESPKTKHIFAGEHALDPNAIIIAAVSGQDYEANAHLIAASKLLLAACKRLDGVFPESEFSELDAADFKDRSCEIWSAVRDAHQAINAAEPN